MNFMRQAIMSIPVFAALLVSDQAISQTKTDETIVVTATVDSEIAEFVGAITNSPNRGQLSRFEQAVCPIAAGVPQAQKDAIVKRIRAVATAAGIRTGKSDCRPNVLLIVTSDRKQLIEKFTKLYPDSMRDASKSERRALLTSTEPAVAWHVKGPLVDAAGAEIAENDGGVLINRSAGSASRLTSFVRPQFAAAVVVVNSSELDGLTTTQLADYAAMRAFLEADPAKLAGTGVSTILRILHADDDAEVPVTLTEWDLNALRGFYNVDRNVSVAAQRARVGKQVKEAADGAGSSEGQN